MSPGATRDSGNVTVLGLLPLDSVTSACPAPYNCRTLAAAGPTGCSTTEPRRAIRSPSRPAPV